MKPKPVRNLEQHFFGKSISVDLYECKASLENLEAFCELLITEMGWPSAPAMMQSFPDGNVVSALGVNGCVIMVIKPDSRSVSVDIHGFNNFDSSFILDALQTGFQGMIVNYNVQSRL